MPTTFQPDGFYPNGEALIALEQDTLRRILNTPAFRDTEFVNLVANADAVYRRGYGSQSSQFNFDTYFCIEDDTDVRRIDVGAQIILENDGTYRQVTYFYAISGIGNNPKHILRKVHFDFEPLINRDLSEAKPSLHFQISGTLPPCMIDAGYQESDLIHLAPFYEKPRFPSLPFSLAILLDIIFHEFYKNTHIVNVLKDATWRSLVDKAERMMILPYLQECAAFMARPHRDELFTSDFLYGITL